MSIVALGMVVTYLLILAAGATVALSVLVWLFQDTSSNAYGRDMCQTCRALRDADSFGSGSTRSARVESERPEDKAA